jgi:hypothetical protein
MACGEGTPSFTHDVREDSKSDHSKSAFAFDRDCLDVGSHSAFYYATAADPSNCDLPIALK